MLTELDYSSSQDTLVFVGDLIAKHPSLQSSLDTLSYLRSLNAHSVRGNHDQSVISFRAYFAENYRRTHPSPDTLTDAQVEEFDYSTWEALDAPAPLANWHPLPKDWTWGSEHWKLARKMSNADATWLANLPLTIHIRPIHAYVIHAGLLPWTVPRSGLSALSDANYTAAVEEGGGSVDEEGWLPPDLLGSLKPDYFAPMTKKTTEYIMNSLEHSVLMVEQNRDPYSQCRISFLAWIIRIIADCSDVTALIEVRGVKKHGRPSKKDSGKPWHKIWNKSMRNCRIFSDTVEQFGIQALELEDEPIESRDLQDEDTGTAEGLDVDSEQEGEGDEDSDDDDDDDGENEEETSTKDIVVQRMKACRKLNVMWVNDLSLCAFNPANLILPSYGHWAGQGLNINKHTFGLDSGAVYGRKLSALIISPHGTYSTERKSSRLQFQDIKVEGRKAVIATLKCKQP